MQSEWEPGKPGNSWEESETVMNLATWSRVTPYWWVSGSHLNNSQACNLILGKETQRRSKASWLAAPIRAGERLRDAGLPLRVHTSPLPPGLQPLRGAQSVFPFHGFEVYFQLLRIYQHWDRKKNPLTVLQLNSGASSQQGDQNTCLVCVLVKKQLVT